MRVLNTVLGPVHPEQMGITASHEHVIWPPAEKEAPPWLAALPKSFEKHYHELMDFKLAGGRTVVDVSGPGLGRDMDLLVLLARTTVMNVVASTGTTGDEPAADLDPEVLADRLSRELTIGIAHTRITAGFIALALDARWAPSVSAGVCRAAARVARDTGAAVGVHGGDARRHVDALVGEGLDASRIIACHLDADPDARRDGELAKRGVYLSYDHVGVEDWSRTVFARPNARRVELVKAMIDAGHAHRILLSCDANCAAVGGDKPPLHALGHLMRYFVPGLREAGIDEDTVQRILVENPKRVIPMERTRAR